MSAPRDVAVKVRTPCGSCEVVRGLSSETCLGVLKLELEERTGVPSRDQVLMLAAVPPAPLSCDDDQRSLCDCGVRGGDQLILKRRGTQSGIVQGTGGAPYVAPAAERGVVVRREVPGDNSCCFHAAAYVLLGRSRSEGPSLREVLAEVVLANPKKFTPDFLGRPSREEYCAELRRRTFWGGAIELSVLSFLHQVEIRSFDLERLRCDRYGTGEGYGRMAFLLYVGTNHYDALAVSPYGGASESQDQTVFSTSDQGVASKMLAFVHSLYKERHSR